MKKLYSTLILMILIGTSLQVNAQISLGGQVSYLKLFGESGINGIGLGINGGYAYKDDIYSYGGFNYYLPKTFEDNTYGYARDIATEPEEIIIESTYKVSMIHIYVGARKYFVGDTESDFGVYGLVEAGYLMVPIKSEVGTYNKSLYFINEEEVSKEILGNFTIDLGIGAEKDFGFGYLFGDLKLNLPANRANGQVVEIVIPASVSINVGVRLPL